MKLDQKVYNLIKENNNELSQSYIAQKLQVSRVTINKAIQRLKQAGVIKVNQPRVKGKFALCFYTVNRVKPTFNNSNTINKLIVKRNNINMCKALLKKKDLTSFGLLIIKYYTNSLITIKTAIKLYKKAVFNIDYYTVCQAKGERSEPFLLDNNKIPP